MFTNFLKHLFEKINELGTKRQL